MSVNPAKYSRRTFDVEGVQVTETNMKAVAEWCGGTIKSTLELRDWDKTKSAHFISVEVSRAQHRRQTMAFPGEWILKSEEKFKVYSERSFQALFAPSVNELERTNQVLDLVTVAMINQNLYQNEDHADEQLNSIAASISARIVGLFKSQG